jgi:hypothetical protein
MLSLVFSFHGNSKALSFSLTKTATVLCCDVLCDVLCVRACCCAAVLLCCVICALWGRFTTIPDIPCPGQELRRSAIIPEGNIVHQHRCEMWDSDFFF